MTAKQEKLTSASIKELLGLTRESVKLDQLYLDPRNPRFGSGPRLPDERIAEEPIQSAAQKKIEKIGVDDLLSSIRTHGFVPTDPIVVREFDEQNFVALEGNRRVATLKKLSSSHKNGEIVLPDVILRSITELEVLVYKGKDSNIAWIIQGLRHMSGIKQWLPLQQATFISKIAEEMRSHAKKKSDPTPKLPAFAKAAGVGVGNANRLLKSYDAFQQAKKDEEYGAKIEESEKFSMFAEAVFKDAELEKWLEWDDKTRRFKNIPNLKRFLSWITEPEGGGEAKVSRAVDMRDVVPGIIGNPDLLRRFEKGVLDLNQARVEIDRNRPAPEPDLESLKARLSELRNLVETLPFPKIHKEKRDEDFHQLLLDLSEIVNYQLALVKK